MKPIQLFIETQLQEFGIPKYLRSHQYIVALVLLYIGNPGKLTSSWDENCPRKLNRLIEHTILVMHSRQTPAYSSFIKKTNFMPDEEFVDTKDFITEFGDYIMECCGIDG